MRSISLDELIRLLDSTPVMGQVNPLALAFYPGELELNESAQAMVSSLDNMRHQRETAMLSLEVVDTFRHRLPVVSCAHDPMSPELNEVLLSKVEWAKRWSLCQSRIPQTIQNRAAGDCVVLMMVDGLSFEDWRRFAPGDIDASVVPCFVDGLSATEQGMRRIVGEPPLAGLLSERGYTRSFGFSYWDSTETLTEKLFSGVTEGIVKVIAFEEALTHIRELPLQRAYVQIIRHGLDSFCHRHRDEPVLAEAVGKLAGNLLSLREVMASAGISGTIFMTADHGILWKKDCEWQLYEPGSGNPHPRYFEGLRPGKAVWKLTDGGRDYGLLGTPFLRRHLHTTEWGTHGGLSYQESFVPFVRMEV